MRILFFGDSVTYGHGLPDCITRRDNWEEDWRNLKPSQLGWASIVSNNLRVECVNLAFPGASNMEIHWRIRGYQDYNLDDIIVVQWSYPNRDAILGERLTQIGPWTENNQRDHYFMAHDLIDMTRRSMLIIEHTALWLSHHGFKWIFLANDRLSIQSHIDDLILGYSNDYFVDYAEDMLHPGIEANKRWAVVVEEHLRELLENDEVDLKTLIPDSVSTNEFLHKQRERI